MFGLVEAAAVQEPQVVMVHLGRGRDTEALGGQGLTTTITPHIRITTVVAVVAQVDQLTPEVLVGLR
tara:strand:+ start:675 stop:875 length:201 start_codon:yes stop_codon:yes gene_type:complete